MKHEKKSGIKDFTHHPLKDITNSKILDAVSTANNSARKAIQDLAIQLIDVKTQDTSLINLDSEDEDEQDEQVNNKEQVNQDTIHEIDREVCMEDASDIKNDLPTLSLIV